jgi:hypothetical protein
MRRIQIFTALALALGAIIRLADYFLLHYGEADNA